MVPMRKHNNFNYLAPDSLELVTTYLKSREDISILAGGTDLIPLIKYGVKKPALLLNLGKIQFLKNIEIREDGIFIGSMITLNELGRNQTINHHFPFVGYSARCVGSPQIRNMGTIGGNILQDRRCIYFNQTEYWRKNIAPCFKVKGGICHQVPSSKMCHAIYYSDLAPIMLAFDTKVELYDGNGVKVVPLKDIIHKHINDSLDRCILTRFFIPYPAPDSWGKFIKYSVRAAIDFSIVNVAVRYSSLTIDRKQGPVVRIFVGAISQEPIELEETGEFLVANLTKLSKLKEEIRKQALKELNTKRSLIRETAITVKVKKNTSQIVAKALEELFINF